MIDPRKFYQVRGVMTYVGWNEAAVDRIMASWQSRPTIREDDDVLWFTLQYLKQTYSKVVIGEVCTDAQYRQALFDLDMSEELRNKIMDPAFKDVRVLKSPLYWFYNTIRMRWFQFDMNNMENNPRFSKPRYEAEVRTMESMSELEGYRALEYEESVSLWHVVECYEHFFLDSFTCYSYLQDDVVESDGMAIPNWIKSYYLDSNLAFSVARFAQARGRYSPDDHYNRPLVMEVIVPKSALIAVDYHKIRGSEWRALVKSSRSLSINSSDTNPLEPEILALSEHPVIICPVSRYVIIDDGERTDEYKLTPDDHTYLHSENVSSSQIMFQKRMTGDSYVLGEIMAKVSNKNRLKIWSMNDKRDCCEYHG